MLKQILKAIQGLSIEQKFERTTKLIEETHVARVAAMISELQIADESINGENLKPSAIAAIMMLNGARIEELQQMGYQQPAGLKLDALYQLKSLAVVGRVLDEIAEEDETDDKCDPAFPSRATSRTTSRVRQTNSEKNPTKAPPVQSSRTPLIR